MSSTDRLRAVLGVACDENDKTSNFAVSHHRHTHDTASKERVSNVPAFDSGYATGPGCDVRSRQCDLNVDNNIHTHGDPGINWTAEQDRAIVTYMTYSSSKLTEFPDILSGIPTVDLIQRWRALDQTAALPPNFGGSWTGSSYANSDSESDIHSAPHAWPHMASDLLSGVADVMDSAPYFWTIIVFKIYKARNDPALRLLVVNDILARHLGLLRSFAKQQLPPEHISDIAGLVDDISEKLSTLDIEDEASLSPRDLEFQAGSDFFEHFGGFAGAYSAVTAIYKYLSDRNVIYPLIKLLVGGSLFAFGSHMGDSQLFTSENIASATNVIYNFFRTGTVGAFMQVFDAIRRLLESWFESGGTASFSQQLARVNEAEKYYQMGSRLLKLQANYAVESVPQRRVYMTEVHSFLQYCRDYLGAGVHVKSPWRAADHIISDRNRVTWFKTTYRLLEAFYTVEITRSMRAQPCTFFFAAGSSIGKTTLQRLLNEMLMTQYLDIPVEQVDMFTYPWPSDEPSFANGASNSTVTVIFDDIGAKHFNVTKATGGDPFVARLLALLNMYPYTPDQAALELKGKIALAPEIVIASTNNPGLDLHLIYKEPAAVKRRIGHMIHVQVAPDFATPTQTLDETKLNRWCLAHPGEVPNAWLFRIEMFTADNTTYNATKKNVKYVTTHLPELSEAPMDTHVFLKWAGGKFAAHRQLYTNILESLNVPFNFGPILRPGEENAADVEAGAPAQPDEIEPQAGSDFWLRAKWVPTYVVNRNKTAPVLDGVNDTSFTAWSFFAVFWAFLLLLRCLLPRIRSFYSRVMLWYENLLPVRIMRGVDTGLTMVSNCQQRKRRALEWLDNNKRTIALLTAIVSAGALAVYISKSKKGKQHECQVGDEHQDSRKGFIVRTTANDKITRWSANDTRLDRTSMYTLSQQSLSASGRSVVAATSDNVVDITFSCGPATYKCAGIMVSDTKLIINRHSLPQYSKSRSIDSKWRQYTMTVHGAGYDDHKRGRKDVVVTHDQIRGNYLPNRDLAGIMLPRSCRPFRDIRAYFPKAPATLWSEDFTYIQSLLPPGTMMSFGKKVSGGIHIAPCGLVANGGVTKPELATKPLAPHRHITIDPALDTDAQILCFQVNTSGMITQPGDCGSPYYLYDKPDIVASIVGIHLGQLTDNSSSKVVVPIYNADIVDLFSDFGDVSEADDGSIMVDTEVQSGVFSQDYATREYVLQRGDTRVNIKLHNSPELSTDTRWVQTTTAYMKNTLGVDINENSFAVVGYDNGGGNLSSSIYRSPLYDAIYNMDSTGLPDSLRCPKDVNNLTRTRRNHDACVNISAIMKQPDYDPQLAQEFMNAADAYLESILHYNDKVDGAILKTIHPVDINTAINGSHFLSEDGLTATNHKGMESMNMKTSPGHPWINKRPSNLQEGAQRTGKYPWFEYTCLPDGSRQYTMGPELEASYRELLELFKQDHNTKVKFVTTCKDEVKKEEKPTRLIMVGPQCLTIICREFLMTICRVMQLYPFVFGAVVGLDATCVQWDQIRNFICGVHGQRSTFDGDYKDFDKSLLQEVTDAFKYVGMSLCRLSGNYRTDQLFVVESIFNCLLSPVVDVFGVVYWFNSLNTSGNTLTTQINCGANNMYLRVGWTRRMKKEMGSAYCERLSRAMFERLVYVITYGDDHVVGVTYPDLIDCRIMEQELSQIIAYTDAHKNKGDKIAPFTAHDKLVFLGRSMVLDKSGSYRPPLEFKRIAKTLLFFKARSGLQYEHMIPDLFRGVLLEIHFHGEEVYNIFYERLLVIMGDHYSMSRRDLENTFFVDSSGELFTYDYFRRWWLGKKDKGYLHDPKYEMAMTPDPSGDQELYDRYLSLKKQGAKDSVVAEMPH